MIDSLPAVNAVFNTLSALQLTLGYWAIRRGRKTLHARLMLGALTTSALFLTTYLVHKFASGGMTRYEGAHKTLYYWILIPHSILAAAMLPLIAVTLLRARRGEFAKHKRLARWTLPIWLYVSVTGVGIYFMVFA